MGQQTTSSGIPRTYHQHVSATTGLFVPQPNRTFQVQVPQTSPSEVIDVVTISDEEKEGEEQCDGVMEVHEISSENSGNDAEGSCSSSDVEDQSMAYEDLVGELASTFFQAAALAADKSPSDLVFMDDTIAATFNSDSDTETPPAAKIFKEGLSVGKNGKMRVIVESIKPSMENDSEPEIKRELSAGSNIKTESNTSVELSVEIPGTAK